MAQVTHESNGLNRLEESFRYTRNISQIPVQSAWREGPEALESARLQALQGRPERLAELMYGGRNGNDAPGDGWRYHGRGYIQLTGKENYRAAGEALDLDLVKHPELAADPQNVSRIAVWYWENRVPEQARNDVRAATLAVNGKYNGLGGKLEREEDVVGSLRRELREEAAIEVAGLTLRGTISWPGFGKNGEDWFGFVFVVTDWTGEPPPGNHEGRLEWVPLARLLTLELDLWPGDRHFLPLVFDDAPAIFHGVMPYRDGQPVSWSYSRL